MGSVTFINGSTFKPTCSPSISNKIDELNFVIEGLDISVQDNNKLVKEIMELSEAIYFEAYMDGLEAGIDLFSDEEE